MSDQKDITVQNIDFVPNNYNNNKKIKRPPSKTAKRPEQKNESQSKTFTISKSFVPEVKPTINQAIAPQLKQLKQFYKKKLYHQKKIKQMMAQGLITKNDLQKPKKQQAATQQEKITVDESGLIRDEKGNILFLKNRTTELAINKRIEENQKLKDLGQKQKTKFHQRISKNLLDRNLVVIGNKKRIRRSRLGLQFMQKGSYQSVSALDTSKKKEPMESLSDVFKEQDQQTRKRIIRKRSRTTLKYDRVVPEIEWWDKPLIGAQTHYTKILEYEKIECESQYFESKIQDIQIEQYLNLFQLDQMVQQQKVGSDTLKDQHVVIPVYLTKDQRKKLKRKRKKEKLQEKNDMIRLGLIEPEKAKLRVANMALVMKNQFVLDPSKVQEEARKQQQERLNRHLETNQARKLTKKQRQQKHLRKLKRDSAKECRRLVFKIGKLDDGSNFFKVNMNAKQLALNGFVIRPKEYHCQIVMVAVQGGARAVKFYKNLLLNRIKWQEGNSCQLVWEGAVDNPTLGKWKNFDVGDESETVKILKEKGVQQFWDYVSC